MEIPTTGSITPRIRLEFSYDSQHRRIQKITKTWNSTNSSWTTNTDTRFLYDDWNLIAEYKLQNSTLILQASHTWGLDISNTPQGAGEVSGLLHSKLVTREPVTILPTYDGNGIKGMNAKKGNSAFPISGNDKAEILKIAKNELNSKVIKFKKGGLDDLTKQVANATKNAGKYAKVAIVTHGDGMGVWFPNGKNYDHKKISNINLPNYSGAIGLISCFRDGKNLEGLVIEPLPQGQVKSCKFYLSLFSLQRYVDGNLTPIGLNNEQKKKS